MSHPECHHELTLSPGQHLQIGDVVIVLFNSKPSQIQLGIDAPRSVRILRAELSQPSMRRRRQP